MRFDLAACYRMVAHYGWDDLVFTHISARLPGAEHRFLINPYGMLFEEVTASSLVTVDLNGEKVMESPFAVNPAGFVIHSAVHAAREDAQCVLHLHTSAGVAVSCQKEGLKPISQQSIFVLASLGYHGYEGVALNEAEKPRLVADLGEKTFLILRSHGLLTAAPFGRRRLPRHVRFAAGVRDPGDGAGGRRDADPDPRSRSSTTPGPSRLKSRAGSAARSPGPPCCASSTASIRVSGLSREFWASQPIEPDPFATETRNTLVLPV